MRNGFNIMVERLHMSRPKVAKCREHRNHWTPDLKTSETTLLSSFRCVIARILSTLDFEIPLIDVVILKELEFEICCNRPAPTIVALRDWTAGPPLAPVPLAPGRCR